MTTPRRCGNGGAVENEENQTTVFPRFPPPLGNRQRRDFHIPTAPTASSLTPQQPDERLAPSAHRARPTTERTPQAHPGATPLLQNLRLILYWNQSAVSGSFSVGIKRKTKVDFRLILGLENAGLPAPPDSFRPWPNAPVKAQVRWCTTVSQTRRKLCRTAAVFCGFIRL